MPIAFLVGLVLALSLSFGSFAVGSTTTVAGNIWLTIMKTGAGSVSELMNMQCMLLAKTPGMVNSASQTLSSDQPDLVRVAHVDLDYIYDPDPAQLDKNLGLLVQRIAKLEITTVFCKPMQIRLATGW